MSICQICHTQLDTFPDEDVDQQLCARCQADVLSKDVYSKSDLRFVGVLAGILSAAVASMPGAFIGDVIGRIFNNATRGCTIGVLVFALCGLVAGFRIGPQVVLRIEAAKREQS